MYRHCLILLLFPALGAVAAAQQFDHPLTLSECLKIAEERHPDLAAARSLVAAAEARVKESRSAYKPRLDSGLSHTQQTYNYAPVPGVSPSQFRTDWLPQSNANAPYYNVGLNLSQTIYDFGRTRSTVLRSQADLDTVRASLDRVRDIVDFNVRNAYYEILAAQELVDVRQETVANQTKHLDQIKAFFEVGRRPKIDVTRQEVSLANAEVDLAQAQENLEVAKAALATAMGLPIQQVPAIVNTLAQEHENENLEALLAEAERNRPDVLAARDQLTAAHADVLLAKSYTKPNIAFSTFFDYRNLGKFPLIYNWSFGEAIAKNLLSGGLYRAQYQQALDQEDAAKSSLDSLLQRVRQEVFTAASDLRVAQDKIALALKAESEAKENLELAEGRYQAGVGNIIELTDAQLLSTDSQAQVVTSRYDYQIAAARLETALGRRVQ